MIKVLSQHFCGGTMEDHGTSVRIAVFWLRLKLNISQIQVRVLLLDQLAHSKVEMGGTARESMVIS
jgi:hypothetical protein